MTETRFVSRSIGNSIDTKVQGAILRSMDYIVQDMVSRRVASVAINEAGNGVQDVVARVVSDATGQ